MSVQEAMSFLSKGDALERLKGIVPKMLAEYISKTTTAKSPQSLANALKHLTFTVEKTYGFKNAQITIGGVALDSINPLSFESIQTKRCYIIGEMLDIDGACGGYNLPFAWMSAYIASMDVLKQINEGENQWT